MVSGGFDSSGEDLGEISYAAGIGQRLPLMLCLDISKSMTGHPIASLNQALTDWCAEIRSDVQLKTSVQIGLVTFGDGGVRVWQGREEFTATTPGVPFVPASEFYPPPLAAGGVTLLTEAVELAIRHVSAYKGWLKGHGYTYYRPLIFLLTDGLPTDATGHLTTSWRRLIPDLSAARGNSGFEFYAIGVGSMMPQGEEVLSTLAPGAYRVLCGFPFRSLLRLLSATIEKVMDGSGQEIPLMTQPVMEPLVEDLFVQRPAGE